MNCKKCGKELADGVKFCDQCGTKCEEDVIEELEVVQEKPREETNQENTQVKNNQDTGSIGWGILGFFIPFVGLILFIIWRTERPKSSKAAGMGALISVIFDIVASFVFGLLTTLGIIAFGWSRGMFF